VSPHQDEDPQQKPFEPNIVNSLFGREAPGPPAYIACQQTPPPDNKTPPHFGF